MVYVLNKFKQPLMPCSNSVARLLLKDDKARVFKKTPFTIILNYETSNFTQDITLGIDTGSDKIGSSAVDTKGNVLYLSEIKVRNDISENMERRAMYRRTRRSRKTRYRQARWLNRRNSIKSGRFSPTMRHKIQQHIKEINFVKSLLPISKTIIETAIFDPHALKNPAVLENKWLYQRGVNYGFANTKAFVLNRDNYKCQNCDGKTKENRLEVHHKIFRRDGGSDEPENLITLCKTCHDKVHRGEIILKGGKKKSNLKHATQMNSIRTQLVKQVECEETFGFVTKENRQYLNLPKEHYFDALAIASQGNEINFKQTEVLYKRCVSSGNYQLTRGKRSEQTLPTGKIHGFRNFDKVKYMGTEYFLYSRMSTGYGQLMNIHGDKIKFENAPKGMKTPKFKLMRRLSARTSCIMATKKLER